ncbi:TonB family protein [Sphingomonas colocasiae]|uniref:Energy transducer TonB n=1 Tax=Sphingomonas colocasiae TaxID=1848973 RepID=A0ABS7PTB2_9SPHN|nr:TonB family protein [Sphingomonas colocasiae]MBY8823214.1 energy transducer TonB [Sphingomonas colocasiae]
MRMMPTIALEGLLGVAGAAEARTWPSAGGWDIGETDDSCGMMMRYEGKGATELTLFRRLDGSVEMMVTNSGWSTVKGEAYKLSYHLNGTAFSGESFGIGDKYDVRKGFGASFKADFLLDFRKSTYLHIYRDETLVDQLSLAGSAAGLAVLERCLAHVRGLRLAEQREKQRWEHIPDDPFSGPKGSKASSAKGDPARWITNDDYPVAAIRARAEGVSSIAWTIDVDGRAIDCKVVRSSGNADLDAAACAALTRRARYSPALDEAGDPVRSTGQRDVGWKLPED